MFVVYHFAAIYSIHISIMHVSSNSTSTPALLLFYFTSLHSFFIIVCLCSILCYQCYLLNFILSSKLLRARGKKCGEIILLPQTVCRWSQWWNRTRKTACHSYRIRNNKNTLAHTGTHKGERGKKEQSKHEIRSNTFSSFVLPSIKKMVQRIEYHSFSFFHSQTRLFAPLKNKWCVRAIAIVIIWYFCRHCCCRCCCHSHRLPSM